MIDLERLWRDAKADTPICAVTGTTKNMVLNAVTCGARSVEDIENAVPLCGGECALRNVSACSCRENAEAILKIYVPIYEMMAEGGGCRHNKPAQKPAACAGTLTDKCGGCAGCGEMAARSLFRFYVQNALS